MSTTKQKKRVTLFINHFIVTHAKAQALVEDTTLTSLVEKALIAYLPPEIIIKKIKI
ncbi:MAG: hypothetical protein WC686_03130 [Candidatus Shapirobacteria bacterium]|jgi:hypothetical protein